MNRWRHYESHFTNDGPCDVWRNAAMPGMLLVVFFEPGRKPLLCDTKNMTSKLVDDIPGEIYETYPHFSKDAAQVKHVENESMLAVRLPQIAAATFNIRVFLNNLHPATRGGWKRMPGYLRENLEQIRDNILSINEWAALLDNWL